MKRQGTWGFKIAGGLSGGVRGTFSDKGERFIAKTTSFSNPTKGCVFGGNFHTSRQIKDGSPTLSVHWTWATLLSTVDGYELIPCISLCLSLFFSLFVWGLTPDICTKLSAKKVYRSIAFRNFASPSANIFSEPNIFKLMIYFISNYFIFCMISKFM